MRGLAILLVVLYHNFPFIDYFFFGWLGVDLFFVLSGFLITDILLTTQQEDHFLRNFYIRRALRIFPLFYLTLIILFFVLPLFPGISQKVNYYIDNQVWLWTYLQNWLFIFKPSSETNLAHHLWSLAVEEQFYLFWPPIILMLKKPKRLLLFIMIFFIIVLAFRCLIWLYKIENFAYFNLYTFTRIDGICIGCTIALLQKTKPLFLNRYLPFIVFAFAGLNFLFYFFDAYLHLSFPYLGLIGYTTLAMLFGLLVHEGVKGNPIVDYIFKGRFLRFLGKISYGLYIFHWPIYSLLFPKIINTFSNQLQSNLWANLAASFICIIIAVAVSVISFYTFERFFLKLKHKFN